MGSLRFSWGVRFGFFGSSKVHFSVLKYRHMVQSFGIYSKVRFALILLNSTEENTRRPSLCLRCLNLFMHDPYFLTWIIRTDFFGDFVQFHAVYTKNIHKLEDFLGHIDVFVYWTIHILWFLSSFIAAILNLKLDFIFDLVSECNILIPWNINEKEIVLFDMLRPPASFQNQILRKLS